MSDRTTINVSKDAHRTASEAKRDGESWTDYLLRCTDEHPADIGTEPIDICEAMEEYLNDTPEVPNTTELHEEIRKAQELAEQARDAAQRVEEGMGR